MSMRTEVDDLDLELAGIDDGGNNAPNVHWDETRYSWVYRASAVNACSLQLGLFRQGMEGSPPPPDMLRRFRDGHLHESAIVAEIQRQRPTWKVHPKDPISGEQYETEYWIREADRDNDVTGIVIVGHIDGLAVNLAMNPDSRIVEAKALSKANYEKFIKALERGNVWEQYPYYRDSITVYMHSLEVPVFYGVKNKDSGEVHVFDLDEPPGDMEEIVDRLRVIEVQAANDALPDDCDRRSYPCFAPGSLVLTENGYRPIGALSIGDKVLTHKGRWRPVIDISTSTKRLRKVSARGVPSVLTTDNHPFLTRSTSLTHVSQDYPTHLREFTDPEWVFADKLNRDHLVGSVLPPITSDADQYPIEVWRLAGRWVADGYWFSGEYADSHRAPVITCGHHEVEGLESMLEDADIPFGASSERTAIKYRIQRSALTELLNTVEFGELAHGKRIPAELLSSRTEIVEGFLDGYLSGDGNLHPQGYWQASTVSKELAYGLGLLHQRVTGKLAGIGHHVRPATSTIEGRTINQRPTWVVRFDVGHGVWNIDDIAWRRVKKSEPINNESIVYDITVEEDESFVVQGMIVHNCPMFRFHKDADDEEDPEAIMAAATGQVDAEYNVDELEVLCREYDSFRASEKEAGAQKKETGRKIMDSFLVMDDKIESANYRVAIKKHTYRGLDEEAMRDDGIDLEKYRFERVTEYPSVTKKKGRK